MTVNEIKRTETVEKVIAREYIAFDGEKFSEEEECKRYEKSAFAVVKNKLKRIAYANLDEVNPEGCGDSDIEIFDITTADQLDSLKQYVRLKMGFHNPYMTSEEIEANVKDLSSLTYGHEVLICWSYDHDAVWCYGDGSIKAYGEYFENLYTYLVDRERKKNESKTD